MWRYDKRCIGGEIGVTMALRWVLGAAAVVGIAEPRAFAGNVVKAGSSQVSSSGEGMKVIG